MKIGQVEVPLAYQGLVIQTSFYLQGFLLVDPEIKDFPLRKNLVFGSDEAQIYWQLLSSRSNSESDQKMKIEDGWFDHLANLFNLLDELEDDQTINYLIRLLKEQDFYSKDILIPNLSLDLERKIFDLVILKRFNSRELTEIALRHPIFESVKFLDDRQLISKGSVTETLSQIMKKRGSELRIEFRSTSLARPSAETLSSIDCKESLTGIDFYSDKLIVRSNGSEIEIRKNYQLLVDVTKTKLELQDYRICWVTLEEPETVIRLDSNGHLTHVQMVHPLRWKPEHTTLIIQQLNRNNYLFKLNSLVLKVEDLKRSYSNEYERVKIVFPPMNGKIDNFVESSREDEFIDLGDSGPRDMVVLKYSFIDPYFLQSGFLNLILSNILRYQPEEKLLIFNREGRQVGYYTFSRFDRECVMRINSDQSATLLYHPLSYFFDQKNLITRFNFDDENHCIFDHRKRELQLDGITFNDRQTISNHFSVSILVDERNVTRIRIRHKTKYMILTFDRHDYFLRELKEER